MEFKQPRRKIESEGTIALIKFMRGEGWVCNRICPGRFGTPGMADWYCAHIKYGSRWIEMKAPGGKLRKTQIRWCKTMAKCGIGVWVLRNKLDYPKLFRKDNWWKYV